MSASTVRADQFPSLKCNIFQSKIFFLALLCVPVLRLLLVGLPSVHKVLFTNHSSNDDEIIAILPKVQTKPQFILHVGPLKTATTTFQRGLTLLQKDLAADGFFYTGRYFHPYVHDETKKVIENASSTAFHHNIHLMIQHDGWGCRECFIKLSDELDAILEGRSNVTKSKNVIMSEEALSHQWSTPEDFQALKDVIGDEWNVTIVISYRRFYEWLPSRKFQDDRTDRNEPNYIGLKHWLHEHHAARLIGPLLPDWFNFWKNKTQWKEKLYFAYSDDILDNVGDIFPVKMLNFHQLSNDTDQVSTFLCDILAGLTPKACEKSKQFIHERKNTRLNTQQDAPSIFYDAIATSAVAKGYINTSAWTRPHVRDALANYHYQVAANNQTQKDFPLICPNEAELSEFLNTSLALEAKLMPHFFDEQSHKAGFALKVAKKSFCWVDAEAVLSQDIWKSYILDNFQ